MVSHVVTCPYCHKAEPVLRHGKNRRGGSTRYRCKDCKRTFTLEPNPRLLTPEKEQRIIDALSERLSIEAVARLLKVSKATIYPVLKKTNSTAA
jgi:transposase-like protein